MFLTGFRRYVARGVPLEWGFGVDVDGLQTDDLAGGPVLQEIAWFDDGWCRLVDFFSCLAYRSAEISAKC